MRWYGRIQSDITWNTTSRRVLATLVKTELRQAVAESQGSVWIRSAQQFAVTTGPKGFWQLTPIEVAMDKIEWLGNPPRGDALSCELNRERLKIVRLTAHRSNGKPIAGVCFVPDGVFRFDEIQQALEDQLGLGIDQNRPLILLASSEKPTPNLIQRGTRGVHHQYSLYHCDNPGCSGCRKPMLVSNPSNNRAGNHVGAIAYACPRCLGTWYDRWALTWLRSANFDDVTIHHLIEYPVSPTEPRRSVAPGPMYSVVQPVHDKSSWGWQTKNIRGISSGFQTFLRTKTQQDLFQVMSREPELVGDLLASILQPGNLRSMIEQVRNLPTEQRIHGIPRAFGHAFCPKRPSAYRVRQDAIQSSHHFYIAYCPDLFMGFLRYYGVADCPGTFLDVGSGIGEKPFVAYACGRFNRCDGLEYDARTLAVADFLLNQLQTEIRYPIRFELGDALQFDRYADYDVIYMYRPMKEIRMMRELFLKIGTDMKIGATCFDVFDRNLAFRRLAHNEYAIVTGADSDGLAVWGKILSLTNMLDGLDLGDGS